LYKLSNEAVVGVIAHELAHVAQGTVHTDAKDDGEKMEAEADELARKWGFQKNIAALLKERNSVNWG